MADSKEKILHKVYTSHEDVVAPNRAERSLIRQAVLMTLRSEGVDLPCVVNVLVASSEVIRKYNSQYRDIDKATDVLSFPMQEFSSAGWQGVDGFDFDEDTGLLPLGDVVMSLEHVIQQAQEYGHSVEREMTYLIIHSTFHLLGYDHMNDVDKKEMRLREKEVVKLIEMERQI